MPIKKIKSSTETRTERNVHGTNVALIIRQIIIMLNNCEFNHVFLNFTKSEHIKIVTNFSFIKSNTAHSTHTLLY